MTTRHRQILIVEDEPNILASLIFIMEREGWSVASVTDGDSAITSLSINVPDMVILDVMLPKRNGFDVLKHIRSQHRLQHLPVMMLTAKGQDQDRNIAHDLGADIFITKPFSNKDVVAHVRRHIENVA